MRVRDTQEPRISVLVVAVDDGDGLRRCLARLREQADPLAAEVVLVINAAEDGLAPAAVAALRENCDVLAFEPAVGKSNALNTGVSLSRGEVIAFTDDDAVPQPGWLKAITEPLLAVDRPPSRLGTGGRVVPVYPDGDPPAWYRRLVDDKDGHFLGPVHDLGDAPREYPRPRDDPKRAPVGASCAYRCEVFQRYRYDPRLGPNRESGGRGGEDVELGLRLLLDGHSLLYVPSARVEHPVTPERLTWPSVRHHYYVNGAEWIRVLRMLDLPVPRPDRLRRRLARRQRRLPFRWLFDPRGHRRRQAKILAARGMLEELALGDPSSAAQATETASAPRRDLAPGDGAWPHVLFVPGGGRTGLGESIRTLVVARAVRERWPRARVGFLVDEEHVRLEGDDFERHTVAEKVSRDVASVNRLLRALAPDLVVFDGRGRGAQIACASRAGARTVYIAAVPTMRRRVFTWSRLRRLDQIWIRSDIVDPRADLTRRERLLLHLAARPRAHFTQTISPLPDSERLAALRRRLGLGEDPFVLFVPGGGGRKHEGRPVPELFAEAAARVHEATGRTCVSVLGPLYEGRPPGAAGVILVPVLSPYEVIDLLSEAQLVVCGGGGVLGQALAAGRVCVAAPAGGSDQPGRIRRGDEGGILVASPLCAEALAERTLALLGDDERMAAIRQCVERSGSRNGLPQVMTLVEGLLGERAPGLRLRGDELAAGGRAPR